MLQAETKMALPLTGYGLIKTGGFVDSVISPDNEVVIIIGAPKTPANFYVLS
ncbi:hypothetical protein RHO15_02530 [Utexia brackfieldae]|uniref:hypothetical protein n=1 Tax=Utexia brackfieldae TaxID=3074108 RepID=UPI00370D1B69